MFRSSSPQRRRFFALVFVLLIAPLGFSAVLGLSAALADTWFGDPIVTPVDRRQLGLRVADLDRDGTDEVIASNTASQYVVYRADSTGMFTAGQMLPGYLWGAFTALDDNQDGWPDLLVQETQSLLRLWRNDGSGQLVDSGFTIPLQSTILSVGRLPGDSVPDLMVRGSDADLLLLHHGMVTGLFSTPDSVLLRLTGEPPNTFAANMAVLYDLNLDGLADVFASGWRPAEWLPEIRWRLSRPDGSFGPIRRFLHESPMSEFNHFTIKDMDADGDPEIAVMWVGFEWGNTFIYSYRRATDDLDYLCTAPGYGLPVVEHLDDDLRADLMMTDYGTTSVYRYLGGSSFQLVQSFPGENMTLASILGFEARDLVYSRRDPNEIHVRRSLVAPASTEEPSLDGRVRLVAAPSVAVNDVRIGFRGLTRPMRGAQDRIEIFDVAGREVRRLPLGPGTVATTWDLRADSGARVAPGVYFLRATLGGTLCRGRVHVLR